MLYKRFTHPCSKTTWACSSPTQRAFSPLLSTCWG